MKKDLIIEEANVELYSASRTVETKNYVKDNKF